MVYTPYGHPKCLKHAVASVVSLRRYDEERMALSKLDLPVYPRLQGHTSPQLDYIEDYTEHDANFEYVACTYYCDQLVYNLRGLKTDWIRDVLTEMLSFFIPGKDDFLKTTPYCLHFGWYHQKTTFL